MIISAGFLIWKIFLKTLLRITEVRPADENLYDITADLTMKQITHPVTFQAAIEERAEGVPAGTVLTLDRRSMTALRFRKNFENLSNKLIHDTFVLDVSIEAF